ncbi:signal peptide peptidase SppA [Candidatus Micrarchaeota archaeon]|nr:signal peptide peptidase SppA [Candidatus Micrarchaeota archaeon]
MEPTMRKKERPNSGLLVRTGLVLVIGFIIVIGIFFLVTTYLTPVVVGKCVGIVNINNPLTIEGSDPSLLSAGTPNSEQIASTVESLNKREDVGAVLFVVNSPGGSVVATREVYDAVKGLNKPKVAYFREVAASGAYYLSTGTDYIISDPDAITGSIGVIATYTDMSGLFEKIGLNVNTLKVGTYKDIGSPYRNMTVEERALLQNMIDEVYKEFRNTVVSNRGKKLNMNLFNNVSDGRIMSGRQALAVGLVDAVGNKKDAIKKAAELGNITTPETPLSIDDIRVCDIPVGTQQAGLFSLDSLIKGFETKYSGNGIKLQYS